MVLTVELYNMPSLKSRSMLVSGGPRLPNPVSAELRTPSFFFSGVSCHPIFLFMSSNFSSVLNLLLPYLGILDLSFSLCDFWLLGSTSRRLFHVPVLGNVIVIWSSCILSLVNPHCPIFSCHIPKFFLWLCLKIDWVFWMFHSDSHLLSREKTVGQAVLSYVLSRHLGPLRLPKSGLASVSNLQWCGARGTTSEEPTWDCFLQY